MSLPPCGKLSGGKLLILCYCSVWLRRSLAARARRPTKASLRIFFLVLALNVRQVFPLGRIVSMRASHPLAKAGLALPTAKEFEA